MEYNQKTSEKEPQNRKRFQNDKFRYGNYNRYYGTRNKGLDHDPRIDVLPIEWIRNQLVLDVGCNVGHLTLSIAKEFEPHRIVGIDIDEHLIGVARKNIRHYCENEGSVGKYPVSFSAKEPKEEKVIRKRKIIFDEDGCNGVEERPHSSSSLQSGKFPNNVWFIRENYVLESDELLVLVREEYDVILALSIIKWIHLNWGDFGICRFFKRAFKHLRPGGRFILEFQDYKTYYKRAKILPDMMENYKKLKLMPDGFKDYLLSDEVGFEKCEELTTPHAISKGYERQVWAFTKKIYSKKDCINDKNEKKQWNRLCFC